MLKINNLTKNFGKTLAVDNLNLTINQGETVVIMGPSGCGKSTAVRLINRLVEPDKGEIILNGQDITKLAYNELCEARKKIGFVFQHFNLIARLTALENVMFGLVMDGADKEAASLAALEALRKVGLENYKYKRPDCLSGGQQQRVAIARALIRSPRLMLWDEPTAALDPVLVKDVLLIIEELIRYKVSAMIIVTHELSFAASAAGRIILMDKGRIAESGAPLEVFTKPVSKIGNKYKEMIEYQKGVFGAKN